MYLCKKKMKQLLVFLMTLLVLASCGKDDSWSPEDDIKEFEAKNPYSVIFENKTENDLFLECEGLASKQFPTLKKRTISDKYHGPNPDITVEYTGEGTHYTTIKKKISLSKEKTVTVPLTYP